MVSRAEQRRLVWSGKMRKTTGGLNRDDLMLNRSGRIVSKRKSEAASKANNLGTWLRVSGQGFKEVPPKKEKTRLQADGQCGEPNPEEGAEKNSQEKHKLQTEHVVVEGTGTRARKLQGRRAVEQEQGAGRRRGARHGSCRQETEGPKIFRPRKNFPVRRRRRRRVVGRGQLGPAQTQYQILATRCQDQFVFAIRIRIQPNPKTRRWSAPGIVAKRAG
jgi:hypothetical protein